MKRYVNTALIFSVAAFIGVMYISQLLGIICGIISIVLSLLHMKTEKKRSIVAIIISTITILVPIVLILALVNSLEGF
ncbi:hypothetical protein J2736_002975 [Paenibacillus qinlingensis]|uniref:DUF4190 domain-containing protein n=1 Tax=Paenibacillus qinlingensis TaxID=1837343 RepID=A0ABU1NWE9_9BACL|nr:hypothetical protein [Paenibacillus qinlingensis]